MTVGELKKYLDKFDDRAEIAYYDHYTCELFPFDTEEMVIEDKFEEEQE